MSLCSEISCVSSFKEYEHEDVIINEVTLKPIPKRLIICLAGPAYLCLDQFCDIPMYSVSEISMLNHCPYNLALLRSQEQVTYNTCMSDFRECKSVRLYEAFNQHHRHFGINVCKENPVELRGFKLNITTFSEVKFLVYNFFYKHNGHKSEPSVFQQTVKQVLKRTDNEFIKHLNELWEDICKQELCYNIHLKLYWIFSLDASRVFSKDPKCVKVAMDFVTGPKYHEFLTVNRYNRNKNFNFATYFENLNYIFKLMYTTTKIGNFMDIGEYMTEQDIMKIIQLEITEHQDLMMMHHDVNNDDEEVGGVVVKVSNDMDM
jgi:hypothetical protein